MKLSRTKLLSWAAVAAFALSLIFATASGLVSTDPDTESAYRGLGYTSAAFAGLSGLILIIAFISKARDKQKIAPLQLK